jgi:hypothetical protein
MPAVMGDLIRVELHGQWNERINTINRFHYAVTQVGPNNRALAQWAQTWANKLFPSGTGILNGVTASVMMYTLVRVSDVDKSDFAVVSSADYLLSALEGQGRDLGESLPAHDCYSIRFQRPTSEWRYGFKRFAGVPEALVQNGALTGTTLVLLEQFAAVLREDWTPEGAGAPGAGQDGASPVLIKAERHGDPVRPVEFVAFSQTSVRPVVSTQVSRKA